MHDIQNLSQLYRLIESNREGRLEVSISSDLLSSLQGCLRLGIAEIISFDPHCLPPRKGIPVIPDRMRPARSVMPEALDVMAALATESASTDVLIVSKDLLEEGASWIESWCPSARLSDILSGFGAVAAACEGRAVTVQREHLQELVDWLDLIMDNRPNRLAERIREHVEAHNPTGLLAKIKSNERMPWEN